MKIDSNVSESELYVFLTSLISARPELRKTINDAVYDGIESRMNSINDMRVEAETTLIMAAGLISKKKFAEDTLHNTRIKKVLLNSGFLGGTAYAKQLAKEIQVTEDD